MQEYEYRKYERFIEEEDTVKLCDKLIKNTNFKKLYTKNNVFSIGYDGDEEKFFLYDRYIKSWNTKPDGSGVSYSDEEEILNLTSTDGDVIKLYAQWAINEYVVKFDSNGGYGGPHLPRGIVCREIYHRKDP